jgi:hypothetical protein
VPSVSCGFHMLLISLLVSMPSPTNMEKNAQRHEIGRDSYCLTQKSPRTPMKTGLSQLRNLESTQRPQP